MFRYSLIITLIFTFGSVFSVQAAKKKPVKKPASSGKAQETIKALMGEFKFGMSKKQVQEILIKGIKKKYAKLILKVSDDLKKDALRAKMNAEIKTLKKNTIEFKGQTMGWDTSIIDDQYAHKNFESMVAVVENEKQSFWFFFNDKLYKTFVTLPKDQYKGFNFAKFQSVIEQAYGKAEEVYVTAVGGESELHHLKWQGSGSVEMWAMDKTDVYGNFVLLVVDNTVYKNVLSSRKDRGVTIPGAGETEINPMVKLVTANQDPNTKKTDPKKDDKKKKKGRR